eukprot:scaffold1728_cov53-Phaeocystis_antarctica.AAC.8
MSSAAPLARRPFSSVLHLSSPPPGSACPRRGSHVLALVLVPALLAWRRRLHHSDQRAARLGRSPEEQLALHASAEHFPNPNPNSLLTSDARWKSSSLRYAASEPLLCKARRTRVSSRPRPAWDPACESGVRAFGAARLLVRVRAQRQGCPRQGSNVPRWHTSVGARDACAVDAGDAEDGAPVVSRYAGGWYAGGWYAGGWYAQPVRAVRRRRGVRVNTAGARMLDREAQVQQAVRRDEQHDVPRQAQRRPEARRRHAFPDARCWRELQGEGKNEHTDVSTDVYSPSSTPRAGESYLRVARGAK